MSSKRKNKNKNNNKSKENSISPVEKSPYSKQKAPEKDVENGTKIENEDNSPEGKTMDENQIEIVSDQSSASNNNLTPSNDQESNNNPTPDDDQANTQIVNWFRSKLSTTSILWKKYINIGWADLLDIGLSAIISGLSSSAALLLAVNNLTDQNLAICNKPTILSSANNSTMSPILSATDKAGLNWSAALLTFASTFLGSASMVVDAYRYYKNKLAPTREGTITTARIVQNIILAFMITAVVIMKIASAGAVFVANACNAGVNTTLKNVTAPIAGVLISIGELINKIIKKSTLNNIKEAKDHFVIEKNNKPKNYSAPVYLDSDSQKIANSGKLIDWLKKVNQDESTDPFKKDANFNKSLKLIQDNLGPLIIYLYNNHPKIKDEIDAYLGLKDKQEIINNDQKLREDVKQYSLTYLKFIYNEIKSDDFLNFTRSLHKTQNSELIGAKNNLIQGLIELVGIKDKQRILIYQANKEEKQLLNYQMESNPSRSKLIKQIISSCNNNNQSLTEPDKQSSQISEVELADLSTAESLSPHKTNELLTASNLSSKDEVILDDNLDDHNILTIEEDKNDSQYSTMGLESEQEVSWLERIANYKCTVRLLVDENNYMTRILTKEKKINEDNQVTIAMG